MNQVTTLPKRSLVDSMAAKYEMEPAAFVSAIKATVIKGDCSNEQFAAFLMVAKEYDLNPLTKEIYAFPDRGGITPIVSIDGWMNLINSHPQFDGMEFSDTHGDDGKLYSVECKMYRKDRARPVSVIEYMSECFRQTDPWKKWPNRMLRHKAAIQCARYAFGFSGIMEPDEYERMKDVTPASAQPSVADRLRAAQEAAQQPAGEREGFSRDFAAIEAETVLDGEILDTDTGPSTELDGGEADLASPSDPERDTLIRYARDVLPMAAAEGTTDASLSVVEREWAADLKKLSPENIEKARAISRSMRAIFDKNTSLESAVEFFADALGCRPKEIGG